MDDKLTKPKSLDVEQLVSINEKLGKLIELNVEGRNSLKSICKYKEDQKTGDIKHRKRSDKQNRLGIFIACAALYISIVGFDGGLMGLVIGLF